MIRSLSKGTTYIELWHKYGSVLICAIETELELMSDHAVFRTKLKPVNDNQRDDADGVFENTDLQLAKMTIRNQQIRDLSSKFLNAYKQIEFVKLEVLYKKKHEYSVELKPLDVDGLAFIINSKRRMG